MDEKLKLKKNGLKCLACDNELVGSRRKYCSTKCNKTGHAPGMVCYVCSYKTRVLETRGTPKASKIYRRRECIKCGCRFSTEETIITKNSKLYLKQAFKDLIIQVNKMLIAEDAAIDSRKELSELYDDVLETFAEVT